MTITPANGATVIRLKGREITDPLYVRDLEEELLEVLEEADSPDLIIDFQEVELLSSRMLGTLVRLLKRARERGGRLRLCSIQSRILHILELTNLNKIFEISPTAEEALSNE